MARTPSVMVPLGTQAPHFSLTDVVSGKKIDLGTGDKKKAKATVIMFICNHCPFVKYINHQLTKLANDYLKLNVEFIAISSNDVENYPDDSPQNMKKTALIENYPFPYLYDETQDVAKAYHAVCTPDFFIFDAQLTLIYRGQLDNSRPGNSHPIDGHSIRHALDCALADKTNTQEQLPSIGCNIKWKT